MAGINLRDSEVSSLIPSTDTADLLKRLAKRDKSAAELLIPIVYDELQVLGRRLLQNKPHDFTLQTGDLVHEAYLRLLKQKKNDFDSRAHFLAIAATVMRRVLIDHVRRRTSAKRGGGQRAITLDGSLLARSSVDLLDVETALSRLEDLDPERAKVVICRVFGEMTIDEIAEALDSSPRTVARRWRSARAWLMRELQAGGSTA